MEGGGEMEIWTSFEKKGRENERERASECIIAGTGQGRFSKKDSHGMGSLFV